MDHTNKIEKIVVPTDFSRNALRALDKADDFARQFDAEIILVHVAETAVQPISGYGVEAAYVPMIRKELLDQANQQLDDQVRRLRDRGLRVRGVVLEGTPHTEINRFAEEEQAGLIIISTHGHTGFQHLLLGSTTERLLRRASCPVLTVRGAPPKPKKQQSKAVSRA